MKNIIITFLLCCVADSAFANIQRLYIFEDSPIRRITIRFKNDSTMTISNREDSNDLRRVIRFTDMYHYKEVNKHQILIHLVNTDREDYNVRKKTILPARLNNPSAVKYSSQIFPLLTGYLLTFSEDFSLLYTAPFLLKSKEKPEWRTKTNLVCPLLYTRLGIGNFKSCLYKYSDRSERNLTIQFIDNKTIELQNKDFSKSGFCFIERYEVRPCKNLGRYKVVKLLLSTKSNKAKAKYLPPLSSDIIFCNRNIFPDSLN